MKVQLHEVNLERVIIGTQSSRWDFGTTWIWSEFKSRIYYWLNCSSQREIPLRYYSLLFMQQFLQS